MNRHYKKLIQNSKSLVFVVRRFNSNNSLIDASKLTIEYTKTPKTKTPYEDLVFGRTFSDHMLEIDWNLRSGWNHPKIIPSQDLRISPAAPCLQYGIECFEGMKAYKDKVGNIRLFRPDMNMARMNRSMTRLSMPAIDGNNDFLECIKQLLKVDQSWIPDKEGYSMYIRPTAIGTSAAFGVYASEDVKLYAVLSPVGPYYTSGFAPVKLYADTDNVRAWPGGVGGVKVGGNYAPTIEPSRVAAKQLGCSQVLWLFGPSHEITEVGAMNIFFVIKKKSSSSNEIELVTPPLTRGDILPGVTRDSIINIGKEWGEFEVSERWITMPEIVEAQREGRLLEGFAAGTGAAVSPVKSIIYKGDDITIPTGDKIGPLALRFLQRLMDIQYGRVANHPWSVPI